MAACEAAQTGGVNDAGSTAQDGGSTAADSGSSAGADTGGTTDTGVADTGLADTGAAADAKTTDTGAAADAAQTTDIATGADTGSGSGTTCPCFDAAQVKAAYTTASTNSAWKPGNTPQGGGTATNYGGCFYQKGGTASDFGKVDKVNWVMITALDSNDAEVYNAWFVAGPIDGKNVCLASKGDSKAANGPATKQSDSLSNAELAACVQALVDVKKAKNWTCEEQH